MRTACLNCTIKHLAQAMVVQIEANSEYPQHGILVVGHLAEASEECMAIAPELASEIRQYRLLVMEDIKTEIPYFNLYNKVKNIIKDKGCGDCNKVSEDFKDKIRRKKDEQEISKKE